MSANVTKPKERDCAFRPLLGVCVVRGCAYRIQFDTDHATEAFKVRTESFFGRYLGYTANEEARWFFVAIGEGSMIIRLPLMTKLAPPKKNAK